MSTDVSLSCFWSFFFALWWSFCPPQQGRADACVCSARWGRWKDILTHGRFKKQLTEWDVESICRALLSYCLVHYRGDDKIKGFMWDLIAPTEDGRTKELQNHLGGSNLAQHTQGRVLLQSSPVLTNQAQSFTLDVKQKCDLGETFLHST